MAGKLSFSPRALTVLARTTLVLASLVSVGWALRAAYPWVYWKQYHEVRAELARIPGIRAVGVWGNEDITLEDIYAAIELDGSRKVHLSYLTRKSFHGKGRFWLDEIGGWTFSRQVYGHHGAYTMLLQPLKAWSFAFSIDLGPDGAFRDAFGVRLDSVQDVLGHYDQILAVLASWPTCPAEATMTGRNGNEIRYAKWRRDVMESVVTGRSDPSRCG